jgi:hypothetical protein
MEILKNSDTVTSTTNLLDFTLKVEVERLIKRKYDIQKNRYKGVYRNLSLLEEMIIINLIKLILHNLGLGPSTE